MDIAAAGEKGVGDISVFVCPFRSLENHQGCRDGFRKTLSGLESNGLLVFKEPTNAEMGHFQNKYAACVGGETKSEARPLPNFGH